ncbi:hypothetical protein Tco_0321551 [Tanacetum coccineum]
MITSMGIRHVKAYTLRGRSSMKQGKGLAKSKPMFSLSAKAFPPRSPMITTMFAATTPENTPFVYHTSTSTNPNSMISPAFVKANYEVLESLLRERRRLIRNEDLRTELEYFSEDYDEE